MQPRNYAVLSRQTAPLGTQEMRHKHVSSVKQRQGRHTGKKDANRVPSVESAPQTLSERRITRVYSERTNFARHNARPESAIWRASAWIELCVRQTCVNPDMWELRGRHERTV